MAKHRAATQVSLAPTHRETELHRFVQRYWKHGAGLAVALALGILLSVWLKQRAHVDRHHSWDRLRDEVRLQFGVQAPDAAVVASLAEELANDPAGPWAKAVEIGKRLQDEDLSGAARAAQELRERWHDHPLATMAFPFDASQPRTLPDQLAARIEALDAWEAAHPGLFGNPPLAEGAPQVALTTERGRIVLGVDEERAPEHAANFLRLVREGYYDGLRFHRVVPGFCIQGGDPNSRDGAPETWGLGGPGYTVPAERTGLSHFPFVLAAAKKGGDEGSSGSQFYITTAAVHGWDGQYVVFGRVLEGEDTVRAIAAGPVEGDRPETPVVIERAEVVGG